MKISLKFKLAFVFLLSFVLSGQAFAYCGDGDVEELQGEQCDDGNFNDGDGCSSYCLLEDVDPPEVVFVSIVENAVGIPTNTASIQITFDEPVREDTVKSSNIFIEHMADPIDTSVELDNSGKKAILTINEDMLGEARHGIHVKAIADLQGNFMQDEYVQVFDTGPFIDEVAPTVTITPPSGEYFFTQNMEIKAYVGDYTGSDVFLDPEASVYYTLDGSTPTTNGLKFTEKFQLREDKTIKFMAVDEAGNQSQIYTANYTFDCPERNNAKEVEPFPSCLVLECVYGYKLKGNACVVTVEDADDIERNSVKAPLFSSSTQLTIATKPAIHITDEHNGEVRRPIKFVDPRKKSTLYFEKDTRITDADRKAFSGYIKPPISLFRKDFPINYGYTFKSIVSFKPDEGSNLSFDPAYKLVVPYTDAYDKDEGVTVFTFDEEKQAYRPYEIRQVDVDLENHEVTITSRASNIFFIAQNAENFNKTEFTDTVKHWARNYAEDLFRRGIVRGKKKGIYAPHDPLSRAEFTKIAINAINEEVEDLDDVKDTYFDDVSIYAWYVPYVNKAKELELINGYDDGTFRPDQPINRAEAIKILTTAFDINLKGMAWHSDTTRPYKDILDDQWYFKPMRFVIENGMLDGLRNDNDTDFFPDWFGPDQPITRGEMAKLAVKMLEFSENQE